MVSIDDQLIKILHHLGETPPGTPVREWLDWVSL